MTSLPAFRHELCILKASGREREFVRNVHWWFFCNVLCIHWTLSRVSNIVRRFWWRHRTQTVIKPKARQQLTDTNTWYQYLVHTAVQGVFYFQEQNHVRPCFIATCIWGISGASTSSVLHKPTRRKHERCEVWSRCSRPPERFSRGIHFFLRLCHTLWLHLLGHGLNRDHSTSEQRFHIFILPRF